MIEGREQAPIGIAGVDLIVCESLLSRVFCNGCRQLLFVLNRRLRKSIHARGRRGTKQSQPTVVHHRYAALAATNQLNDSHNLRNSP